MPNYDMHCLKDGCGYKGEHSFSMFAKKREFPHCPRCDSLLEKSVQAPNITSPSFYQHL